MAKKIIFKIKNKKISGITQGYYNTVKKHENLNTTLGVTVPSEKDTTCPTCFNLGW